jgi:hypothetical protein
MMSPSPILGIRIVGIRILYLLFLSRKKVCCNECTLADRYCISPSLGVFWKDGFTFLCIQEIKADNDRLFNYAKQVSYVSYSLYNLSLLLDVKTHDKMAHAVQYYFYEIK